MARTRPIIMGVLNLTPDSFSDGAMFDTVEAAVKRATHLRSQGADLIDIGGESTRPGATLVGASEEQRRVLPVIEQLAKAGIPMSIDSVNASTAEQAVLAGARTINDVSGGLHDPDMFTTVARLTQQQDLTYIIGHWRGVPDPDNVRSGYDDVVTEVAQALAARADAAMTAGVPRHSIVLDPGFGFDKTAEQGWELLTRFDELLAPGFPVCVGVSRKRMLGEIVRETTGEPGDFADRDLATAVVSALAARSGAWGVRVHDVLGSAQALAVESRVGPQPAIRDRITLTGLEVHAHHGVYEFEREAGQRFVIDVEVGVDLRRASASDDLNATVNYGDLATQIVESVQRDPVDLIETVAERVARTVLHHPTARTVRVTVHKPEAPIEQTFHDVSVTIERGRS